MNIKNIFRTDTEKTRLGRFGENTAVKYLKKNGYRICKRNFIAADAEIDIIAENKDTTVFVEVKTRRALPSFTTPRAAAAVTPEKQRKILRAAAAYREKDEKKRYRFDVIEVYAEGSALLRAKEIRHLVGTFNRDTAFSRR